MSNRSGNLVKSYFLNRDEESPRVIDSNMFMEETLERIRMVMPQVPSEVDDYYNDEDAEFQDGLDADTLDALMMDSEEAYDEDGNPVSNVIKAAPAEEYNYQPEPVYDGPSPEELIAEAEARCQGMMLEAQAEIDRQKSIAYEEGKAMGYEEGRAALDAEAQSLRASIENERRMLEAQYEEKVALLEPQFVHTLTSIYEKIFEVDLSDEESLILTLLRNTMSSIEASKHYMIHVSREDYSYVMEHKYDLLGAFVSDDTVIDIVEDVTMKKNDGMIETVNGIFDCSLGTELAALRKKLELLSYTPD